MATTSANLMEHLQTQGYYPSDDPDQDGWFDLTVSGVGTVRVCVLDGSYEVFVFDKFMCCDWQARFDGIVPDAAVILVARTAERQLADTRGDSLRADTQLAKDV